MDFLARLGTILRMDTQRTVHVSGLFDPQESEESSSGLSSRCLQQNGSKRFRLQPPYLESLHCSAVQLRHALHLRRDWNAGGALGSARGSSDRFRRRGLSPASILRGRHGQRPRLSGDIRGHHMLALASPIPSPEAALRAKVRVSSVGSETAVPALGPQLSSRAMPTRTRFPQNIPVYEARVRHVRRYSECMRGFSAIALGNSGRHGRPCTQRRREQCA